jgi:hypothetical protein
MAQYVQFIAESEGRQFSHVYPIKDICLEYDSPQVTDFRSRGTPLAEVEVGHPGQMQNPTPKYFSDFADLMWKSLEEIRQDHASSRADQEKWDQETAKTLNKISQAIPIYLAHVSERSMEEVDNFLAGLAKRLTPKQREFFILSLVPVDDPKTGKKRLPNDAEVASHLEITKQATNARRRSLPLEVKEFLRSKSRHLQSLQREPIPFSQVNPGERRESGIDECYRDERDDTRDE